MTDSEVPKAAVVTSESVRLGVLLAAVGGVSGRLYVRHP